MAPPVARDPVIPRPGQPDPAQVQAMFGAITPAYDRLNRLLSGTLDRRWRRLAARAALAGLESPRRLLDVATGTGDLAAELARQADCAIVGADFTRPMLDRAAGKFGRRGFDWIEADALALPFADAVFDAVTIAFGLRNVIDRPRALSELTRVARPGGRVVILEFGTPRRRPLRALYDFYSFQVMPRVGRWLSGSDAYLYLARSIRNFWNEQELARAMESRGLHSVTARPLLSGIVWLHVGVKR